MHIPTLRLPAGAIRLAVGRLFAGAGLALLFGALAFKPVLPAEAVPEKIRLVFGVTPGGSYSIYSQLVSTWLPEYLPGNPTITIESMPGAGGLVAMSWLDDVAPRDGSVIAVVRPESVFDTLMHDETRFDATRFSWIGRLVDLQYVGVASRRSGIDDFDDFAGREVIAGAPDLRGASATAPMMYNRLAGTRFRTVSGYQGSASIFHAMNQGELDFFVLSWAAISTAHRERLKSGEIRPVLAYTEGRIADLPGLPSVYELVESEADRAFLDIFLSSTWVGRALVAPPGIPNTVLKEYRRAFDRMLQDPGFQADARDLGAMLSPLAGAEIEQRVAELLAMPPERHEQARAVYEDLLDRASR